MRFVLALAVLVLVFGWNRTVRAHGAFVVNTTADADDGSCDDASEGDCSLREAINAANALINDHPDAPDSIGFDFGLGAVAPFIINVASPLPEIIESVIIDGSTEPRYIVGLEHVPVIIVDGGGFDQVFRVRAHNTLILTLALTNAGGSGIDAENADFFLVRGCYFGIHPLTGDRLGADPQEPAFGSHAIRVSASYRPRIGGEGELAGNVIGGAAAEAIVIEGGDDLVLVGNRIGVDPSGSEARPNCLHEPTAFAVTIAGANSAQVEHNVISANLGAALRLVDVPSASVEQNRIGVDITGRVALGNASLGIHLGGNIDGVLIQSNVISANGGDGVLCAKASTGQWAMWSNVIGIDLARSQVLPNGGHGVSIASGCEGAAIGAIGFGLENVIAHNVRAGIRLEDGASSVRGNSVFLNGDLGIDAGAEGVTVNDVADALLPVNFPEVSELTQADGTLVIRGCTVAGATIDVYEASADPSGFGEGLRHLGAIIEGGLVDGDGATGCSPENDAAFSLRLETEVTEVTLTATSQGGTSEFSPVYPEAEEERDPGCDGDMFCDAPTPVCNLALRRCQVCVDDEGGSHVDSGCTEEAPLCTGVVAEERGCSAAEESEPDAAEPPPEIGQPDSGGCSVIQAGSRRSLKPTAFLIFMGILFGRRNRKVGRRS